MANVRSRALAIGLIVLAALSSLPVAAQRVPDPPDAVRYSLADCLRIALENNLDLVSARKDPSIAEQQIARSLAPFDGVLGAGLRADDSSADSTFTTTTSTVPTPITTDGASDSDSLAAQVSFSHLLDFGASYDLRLARDDGSDSTSSIDTGLFVFRDNTADATSDAVTLTYSMPLLKGFGKEVNTVNVLLARSGLEVSREDLRLQALLTAKQVEDAYWNLLAARAALDVEHESLELARDLYELNKKKVEVGTLAPIEITQAEAGVASREEGVIVAETLVANAEDELRRLLAVPKDDPAWSRRIVPVDRPQFEARTVDGSAALAKALERRPELAAARIALRDDELSERVAKRGLRHELNLEATVQPFRGDRDETNTNTDPTGSESIFANSETDGRFWAVGLVYSYPLRNRAAKADYAIASLNREKSRINLQSVEQDISVDVRMAVRAVESGVKRVDAARSATVLQRKTLEAEQKKFENGMSTSFEVLQIQEDLSQAQLAEIRAILDYTRALADLERAQGTLLEARGLSIGP